MAVNGDARKNVRLDASLIRESVAAALHGRRFLRGLGLSARGIAAVTRRE